MDNQTYRVVCELNVMDLVSRVNALRAEGWIPQGGLSVDSSGFKYQALVRPLPKPEAA